jgi:hypothetical protein
MKPRAASTGIAVLGLLMLAGCSAVPDHPANTKKFEAVLDVDRQSISLPLSEYFTTDQQAQTVQHANALLVRDCLEPKGFSYLPAGIDWQRPAHVTDRRYGIWSLDSAGKYGYDVPDDDSRSPAQNPELLPVETAGYDEALLSCVEDLSGELIHEYLPYQADSSLADRGLFESQAQAQTDPAYIAARGDWVKCLNDAGLLLTDSEQGWVPELPASKEGQIEVALVDVRCKDAHRTIQRLADVEAKYEGAFELQHEEELRKLLALVHASVSQAEELISRHE